jgi:integrase
LGKVKSKKSRNVPLSPRVVDVLKKWQGRRHHEGGQDYVFHRGNSAALSLTWLDQQHKAVRETLNAREAFQPKFPAEFVLHSLRHTFGTRLGELGRDVFTIMRMMGHSSIAVSKRYVHLSPKSVERAFERLNTLNRQRATTVSTTVEQAGEGAVQ